MGQAEGNIKLQLNLPTNHFPQENKRFSARVRASTPFLKSPFNFPSGRGIPLISPGTAKSKVFIGLQEHNIKTEKW